MTMSFDVTTDLFINSSLPWVSRSMESLMVSLVVGKIPVISW